MKDVKAFTRRFVANEQGLETVEYAVMTALIVAAIAVSIAALAVAVTGQTNRTAEVLGDIDGGS